MRNIVNGGSVPDVQFGRMAGSEVQSVSARELFAFGRSVVLGIPGAFTPVCTKQHVPDFVKNADRLRASGISHLICVAPNDPFVLDVFARKIDPNNKIEFLSDGILDFASALNLKAKNQKLFVGWRSERYLLVIENGLIAKLRVEPNILTYSCTRAIDALDAEYV